MKKNLKTPTNIVGKKRHGFRSKMFRGTLCIVTPEKSSDRKAVRAVTALWKQLGCRVILMSPAEHDRTLALTSHVPHFTAAALCLAVLSGDKRRERVLEVLESKFRTGAPISPHSCLPGI